MLLSEKLRAARFISSQDHVAFAMALDLKSGAVSMRPTNDGTRLIYKYASGGHGTSAPSRYCTDLDVAFTLWHDLFPDVFLEIEKSRGVVVASAKGLREARPIESLRYPSQELARCISNLILRLKGL